MLPRIGVVKCDDADYILFSTKDLISRSLYEKGSWESHLLKVSRMFLRGADSPLIVDIGANLGAYSIPLAKEVQNVGGVVYGYEPQRIVYYQLCGNVVLNRLDNYFAFNHALGDYDGEIAIPGIDYNTLNNVGAFSFNKYYREKQGIELSMNGASAQVQIRRLDNMELPKAPCLIKLDVEGFELDVLKGSGNFLERHKFPPILFEAWDFDWFKEGKQALLAHFEHMGYVISVIAASDYIAQHPNHSAQIDFARHDNGTIGLHRSR